MAAVNEGIVAKVGKARVGKTIVDMTGDDRESCPFEQFYRLGPTGVRSLPIHSFHLRLDQATVSNRDSCHFQRWCGLGR